MLFLPTWLMYNIGLWTPPHITFLVGMCYNKNMHWMDWLCWQKRQMKSLKQLDPREQAEPFNQKMCKQKKTLEARKT